MIQPPSIQRLSKSAFVSLLTDFEVGSDKLVLTQLLESVEYGGVDAIADKCVRFVAAGSGTMLSIAPDGVMESGVFRPLLWVENESVAALSKDVRQL